MPSANVYDMDGQIVREEHLDNYVFGAPINTAVLHQVVTAQLVNRRQGTASTKTRAEVRGGSKKPYRQKGTGRARQGSTRAPHWRGGGTAFGPRPHAYERAIPRKMKRIAIRSALSDKAANGRILLMERIEIDAPRTKDMEALLSNLPVTRTVLLLLPARDENVILSARNIPAIRLGHVDSTNVIELLKYDHLLMTLETARILVKKFGRDADDRLQMKRHPNVVLRRRARAAHEAAKLAASGKTTATAKPARTAKAAATSEEKAPKAPRTTKAATSAKADAGADATAEKAPKTTRKRATEKTEKGGEE
ncbi:MAG TPA: 50S ribosomal protein L4 [Ktedonobacterales bacterium]|jgi:large subunit ribosomal protein L4|nr:50S ribosomal protein L4 [Ktedonobacterales bacterium]